MPSTTRLSVRWSANVSDIVARLVSAGVLGNGKKSVLCRATFTAERPRSHVERLRERDLRGRGVETHRITREV